MLTGAVLIAPLHSADSGGMTNLFGIFGVLLIGTGTIGLLLSLLGVWESFFNILCAPLVAKKNENEERRD